MREIKFRGLNHRDEWQYGYVAKDQFGKHDDDHYPYCNNKDFLEYETVDTGLSKDIISYGYKIYIGKHHASVWVKRETIGQYTGLKDKNGREIFDSDYVKFKIPKSLKKLKHIKEIHLIKFPEDFLWVQTQHNEIEVVGNLYENPRFSK